VIQLYQMNIFVLDLDPKKAARDHCDNHIVKMVLEGAQILGSTHWISNGVIKKKEILSLEKPEEIWKKFPRMDESGKVKPYGIGFANHPSSKWSRYCIENWQWLVDLCIEMTYEHERRWGKITTMRKVIEWFASNPPQLLSNGKISAFYQAVPDHIKGDDPVHAYRLYYAGWKEYFAKWKKGEPDWWKEYLEKTVKENLMHDRVIQRWKEQKHQLQMLYRKNELV